MITPCHTFVVMAGIYIHVPFCKQACHYCDFHFSTQQDSMVALCQALAKELALQKDFLNGELIETIYFGGGTPSLLSEKQLTNILNAVYKYFTVAEAPEVTLEANPDDLTKSYIQSLIKVGINRLSIGVQSFDDDVLRFLNRSHHGEQALRVIDHCRNSGINKVNADLIYAIPNRDLASLQRDLAKMTSLKPDHISAYSLTIEPNTVFGKWSNQGKFISATEDENANQFDCVMNTLAQSGYEQYEISNYCLPGCEAIHNTNYWRQKKYLGIGPSAHSFNGLERWSNVQNNYKYIKSVQEDNIPATIETLSRSNKINEYIMTSLRTKWGCNLQFLQSTYKFNLADKHAQYVKNSQWQGLITLANGFLNLTDKGKYFADSIASELFEV